MNERLGSDQNGGGIIRRRTSSSASHHFIDIKKRRDSIGSLAQSGVLLDDGKGNNNGDFDVLIKLLMLGDSGVGKSSLLTRFCDDSFNPSFITTVGIDFKIRTIQLDGKRIKLQIWDTAGQERFRTVCKAFYRGAMGIVLVYSLLDPESLKHVQDTWIPSIRELAQEGTNVILVGNKADMVGNDYDGIHKQAHALAKEEKLMCCESSAKEATNVNWIFVQLTKVVMSRVVSVSDGGVPLTKANDAGSFVVLHQQRQDETEKKKCCS